MNAKRIPEMLVLFVRVGWMKAYAGPVPGDEKPLGGGGHNFKNVGHELYNFLPVAGQLFGYFQPSMVSESVALERITQNAASKDQLSNVLIIFVARRYRIPGQVIVGWYDNATVFRRKVPHAPGRPTKFGYFCKAKRGAAVLLPDSKRHFPIPHGKGGMGQANVCYPLEHRLAPKNASWMADAVRFVQNYSGPNIIDPDAAAVEEAATAAENAISRSTGQGFAISSAERRIIEIYAMKKAEKYFQSIGFRVVDVSAKRSYDLECRKGKNELHVEVKGTTTTGATVILTKNEVRHAQDKTIVSALYVQHSVKLKGKRAYGGDCLIYHPWTLAPSKLTAITFTYKT